ncbi:MAG: Hsp20/alpha crystallin family protein [Synergistaceae bacterium]|jgi:HSP20 family protein|nr:Hsp20/alpha crystallin family protein [Synergistaceae bacterium]
MFALTPFRSNLASPASHRRSLLDIDDLFNRLMWTPGIVGQTGLSDFDMYEQDGKLNMSIEAPGVNPDEVEIRTSKDRIQIKSKSESEDKSGKDDEGKTWYSKKTVSSFNYDVSLPFEIDTDKAEALFENGVIHISAPRLQISESKVLSIKKA